MFRGRLEPVPHRIHRRTFADEFSTTPKIEASVCGVRDDDAGLGDGFSGLRPGMRGGTDATEKSVSVQMMIVQPFELYPTIRHLLKSVANLP